MERAEKYFEAKDSDQAKLLAAQYFACEPEAMEIEMMREGSETLPGIFLAKRVGERDKNGSFMLSYEEQGVYAELYLPKAGGSALDRNVLAGYVQRKNIKMLDPTGLASLLEKGWGRSKIAPAQEELVLGEEISVAIPADEMEAVMRLLAPDEGGALMDADMLRSALGASGVVYGILDEAIEAALSEHNYQKSYVVARAKPAVNGENGVLTFHFSTEQKTAAPKDVGEGKINYKDLDLFEAVKEGQLLVSRTLATPGEAGTTVKGKELKPKPGREAQLPRAKNALANEEKTGLFSQKSGMVEYVAGMVVVSDIYMIKGDCDLSVGNIDFDGSVVVQGNVISGMFIKAAGAITVGGVVEGAELVAGGSIELKRGVQGMDRGKITAGGSVSALFIERAKVVAGESVVSDVVMHSKVEAGKSLYAKGKRGSIVGSDVRVTGEVVARSIGSQAHTQTDVEVGLVPQKRARLQTLQQELIRIAQENGKLEKLEQYLTKTQANVQEENRAQLFASVQESRHQNAQLRAEYTEELDEIQQEAAALVNGRVHVTETAYPGTRITIASDTFRVEEPIPFATFKFSDGKVIFTACEAGKS